jgi:hypothetical protein
MSPLSSRLRFKLWFPVGVPRAHHFGQEGLHNVLVIDLLGPNLENLLDMCGRKFSIKTVCMAAKQMVSDLDIVSYFHVCARMFQVHTSWHGLVNVLSCSRSSRILAHMFVDGLILP